jgi:hypothetical protein
MGSSQFFTMESSPIRSRRMFLDATLSPPNFIELNNYSVLAGITLSGMDFMPLFQTYIVQHTSACHGIQQDTGIVLWSFTHSTYSLSNPKATTQAVSDDIVIISMVCDKHDYWLCKFAHIHVHSAHGHPCYNNHQILRVLQRWFSLSPFD